MLNTQEIQSETIDSGNDLAQEQEQDQKHHNHSSANPNQTADHNNMIHSSSLSSPSSLIINEESPASLSSASSPNSSASSHSGHHSNSSRCSSPHPSSNKSDAQEKENTISSAESVVSTSSSAQCGTLQIKGEESEEEDSIEVDEKHSDSDEGKSNATAIDEIDEKELTKEAIEPITYDQR
jgi:hypothetical protein